jgi:hypothetical protein
MPPWLRHLLPRNHSRLRPLSQCSQFSADQLLGLLTAGIGRLQNAGQAQPVQQQQQPANPAVSRTEFQQLANQVLASVNHAAQSSAVPATGGGWAPNAATNPAAGKVQFSQFVKGQGTSQPQPVAQF